MFPREGTLWGLGGLCAKSSCPLPDACKSSSSKVKGGRCVFNLPKLTRIPSGRNARTLAHVQPPLVAEVIPWCSSSCASRCSPDSSNEAVVAFC